MSLSLFFAQLREEYHLNIRASLNIIQEIRRLHPNYMESEVMNRAMRLLIDVMVRFR